MIIDFAPAAVQPAADLDADDDLFLDDPAWLDWLNDRAEASADQERYEAGIPGW